MGHEIERKFCVTSTDFLEKQSGLIAKQGYVALGPPASVRVRIMDGEARLNIKEFTSGASRQEFEYPIPLEDGEALLHLCVGRVVEKTRYHITHGAHVWEVDVFSGANEGLVIAEIELGAEEEEFERPPWLGKEVTEYSRYYNASLTEHPFTQWTD